MYEYQIPGITTGISNYNIHDSVCSIANSVLYVKSHTSPGSRQKPTNYGTAKDRTQI